MMTLTEKWRREGLQEGLIKTETLDEFEKALKQRGSDI